MTEVERFLDISVPVGPEIPVWPDTPRVMVERRLDLDRGDPVNDTTVRFSVHTGTHVDAPLHFLADGAAVDALPIHELIGPAFVADARGARDVDVTALEDAAIPGHETRVLFRTRNSERWRRGERSFDPGYAALTAEAAARLVDRGVRLVGIDYHSVQRFDDGPETHRILLEAGVVIVEGLDLSAVEPGPYELVCLPLRLAGIEAAPARAVLRPRRGQR